MRKGLGWIFLKKYLIYMNPYIPQDNISFFFIGFLENL